jgi:hypothetical protein
MFDRRHITKGGIPLISLLIRRGRKSPPPMQKYNEAKALFLAEKSGGRQIYHAV